MSGGNQGTIIPAAAHNTAPRGAKVAILGRPGVGKTSLPTTLFCDVEAGYLAIADLAVDTIRLRTWPQIRDLAFGGLRGSAP
jgi:ABC-type transport system involved in cytochrome bd biosynthesis fused ATPase/permease subunit